MYVRKHTNIQTERYEILRVLSKDVKISIDVNLHDLASRTPNFTGADLKAMLYNAQLQAAHAVLDKRTNGGVAAPSAIPAAPPTAVSHVTVDADPEASMRWVTCPHNFCQFFAKSEKLYCTLIKLYEVLIIFANFMLKAKIISYINTTSLSQVFRSKFSHGLQIC